MKIVSMETKYKESRFAVSFIRLSTASKEANLVYTEEKS